MARKMTTYVATAPNGTEYRWNASSKPAAIRFLFIPETWADRGPAELPYIISTHKSVPAASTSFQTPVWRNLLRPDSVVTDIREA